MTIQDIAKEYRDNISVLELRTSELKLQTACASPTHKYKLQRRIKQLESMIYEGIEVAIYLEQYRKKHDKYNI